MPNISPLYRISQISKSILAGIDWAWNPTHTKSALAAVQGFLNQKTSYPNINKQINSSPESKIQFESKEFSHDMQNHWDLDGFLVKYSPGMLGYEYANFMKRLGYKPLDLELADHVPILAKNIMWQGARNHDIVHFLFQLYDEDSSGKLNITDYHEWVFLSWTIAKVDPSEKAIVDSLLLPAKLKAFVTCQYSKFQQATSLGKKLAITSKDLNLIWFLPYFGMPVGEVRRELGIVL